MKKKTGLYFSALLSEKLTWKQMCLSSMPSSRGLVSSAVTVKYPVVSLLESSIHSVTKLAVSMKGTK